MPGRRVRKSSAFATNAISIDSLVPSVYAAAIREAAEEIGVIVTAEQLRPLCAMHRTHGNGRPVDERVDFFFECRSWSGEPQRLEPHKSADLRWWRLDDLPDNVVPHERGVLDTLLSGRPAPVVTYGF